MLQIEDTPLSEARVQRAISVSSSTSATSASSDDSGDSRDNYLPSPSPTPTKKLPPKSKPAISSKSTTGYPSLKRSRSSGYIADEDQFNEDIKPDLHTPCAKRPKTEWKTCGNNGSGSEKKGRSTGSWTKAETKALWDAMGITASGKKWDEIAGKVPGRDKLSCQNKWRYDLLPKIQAYVASLGE